MPIPFRRRKNIVPVVFLALILGVFLSSTGAYAAGPDEERTPPSVQEQNAARLKVLQESLPPNMKLLLFLDCGREMKVGGEDGRIGVELLNGKPYCFAQGLDVDGAFPSQSHIQFDEQAVSAKITGLEPGKKYRIGFSWWDFDDGGRTQMVVAKSPDQRTVRMPVPAIRVPDYKTSGQLAEEKDFALPTTVVRDGEMLLVFHQVTGPNVVVSEIWIVEQTDE